MALITLVNETKLKSLKFGQDRPQGGSSREPFIQAAIPESQAGRLPRALSAATSILAKLPGITDPGIGLATQASLTDAVRLGKFFTTPQGLLFATKQNLLSRISVRTQASGLLNDYAYLPTSTLAQAGVNVFGGHLNKQGENPFLGFGDAYTPDRYFDAIVKGSRPQLNITLGSRSLNLRLPVSPANPLAGVGISRKFRYPKLSTINVPIANNRLVDLRAGAGTIALIGGDTAVDRYKGGPGSIAGVGWTTIRTATDNEGNPLRTLRNGTIGTQQTTTQQYAVASEGDVEKEFNRITKVPLAAAGAIGAPIIDFRQALRRGSGITQPPAVSNLIASSSMAATQAPDYSVGGRTNLEARVNLNNPAAPGRNLTSYTAGTGVNTYDKINAFPIYRSEIIPTDYAPKVNDLVKFRIAAIDNDNPLVNEYIHFRAFLGTVTDNYNADWDSVQYMGRGDKLYSYKGFGRSINLSWTIAAQSKKELIPMYQKLNFLASNLAPDYNSSGYMRGPLVNLTVGGYLYEVPGFITAMTLEMSEEYPWEVGIGLDGLGGEDRSVKELSQIIRVSGFNFTPIHRFIPRKQVNTYGDGANGSIFAASGSTADRIKQLQEGKGLGVLQTYGPTRFISLNVGSHNNYDNDLGTVNPSQM